ncbi:MAG: polysaccharide biosynthesis C-terminal domain-containing protein [Candidatus Omnitrophota bacterium]
MIDYFKNFIKHSMIYSVGNIIHRLGSLMLIPLYTKTLGVEAYGALEMFYVFSNVLRTFLGLMVAHATLRFYFEYKNEVERKEIISTALIASLSLSLVGIFILWGFLPQLSLLIFKIGGYTDGLKLILFIVLFELMKEIGLAYLRAKEKSLLYISLAVTQLVTQVGFNLFFVLYLKRGVQGILTGNLISTIVVWSVIITITLKYSGIRFSLTKLRVLLKYCLPFVFSTFSAILITNADRVILSNYKTLASVGIYALSLRFGLIIKEMIVEPFSMNFGQSRFAIMYQENAKEIYAKVMTYFIVITFYCALWLAIFTKEVLKIISSEEFFRAGVVIPIILLSVITVGMNYVLQTGILIKKKTKYLFYISICTGILAVVLNRIMIPIFDAQGAAVANWLVAISSCVLTFYFSNKIYPVPYDFLRIFKICSIAVIFYFLGASVDKFCYCTLLIIIQLKLLLLISFPFVLYFFGIFEQREKNMIIQVIKKIRMRILK